MLLLEHNLQIPGQIVHAKLFGVSEPQLIGSSSSLQLCGTLITDLQGQLPDSMPAPRMWFKQDLQGTQWNKSCAKLIRVEKETQNASQLWSFSVIVEHSRWACSSAQLLELPQRFGSWWQVTWAMWHSFQTRLNWAPLRSSSPRIHQKDFTPWFSQTLKAKGR